jgi:hypothetical protein
MPSGSGRSSHNGTEGPCALNQHEQHAGQSIGAPNVNSLPLDNSMLRIVTVVQQFDRIQWCSVRGGENSGLKQFRPYLEHVEFDLEI